MDKVVNELEIIKKNNGDTNLIFESLNYTKMLESSDTLKKLILEMKKEFRIIDRYFHFSLNK